MRRLLPVLMLALSASLVAFATPASAGTQEEPEIEDGSNDHALTPAGQATGAELPNFGGADIRAVWIDNETAAGVKFHLLTGADLAPGVTTFTVTMMADATEVSGTIVVNNDGQATTFTAGGIFSNAVFDTTPNIYTVDAAMAGFGGASSLSGFFATADQTAGGVTIITDRAPDTDASAATYAFQGASSDSDGDGLNDEYELDNFGDLTQTGEDDFDADGLNNSAENEMGTDPTLEDTDGDGASDGDEVAAGTDPLDPDSTPAVTPTPTATPTGTPTASPTATATPTPVLPPTPPADTTDEDTSDTPKSLSEMVDKLKGDTGYLAIAAILAVGIIILALIALLGRWKV